MTPDYDFLLATAVAVLIFGAIAVYTPTLLEHLRRQRRLKPPHRAFLVIFRLWFAALAAASFGLLLFSRHGLLDTLRGTFKH